MARQWVRVAFPEHITNPMDSRGYQWFTVPGEYYGNGVPRSFKLPVTICRKVSEPAHLLHSHAIYTTDDEARHAGIAGIDNPRMPRKLRREI